MASCAFDERLTNSCMKYFPSRSKTRYVMPFSLNSGEPSNSPTVVSALSGRNERPIPVRA